MPATNENSNLFYLKVTPATKSNASYSLFAQIYSAEDYLPFDGLELKDRVVVLSYDK